MTGKRNTLGLGTYPDVSLRQARERREDAEAGRVGECVEEVGETFRAVLPREREAGPDRLGAGRRRRHGDQYIHET